MNSLLVVARGCGVPHYIVWGTQPRTRRWKQLGNLVTTFLAESRMDTIVSALRDATNIATQCNLEGCVSRFFETPKLRLLLRVFLGPPWSSVGSRKRKTKKVSCTTTSGFCRILDRHYQRRHGRFGYFYEDLKPA